ncbi:erythrocyte membrane protein 1, PfEMP1 [Plasmodium reichenowi]|uniref:Erythrocyte membrane protein 1, PfEMP1 n=1 Tax=Plasmodium reichenowi TaxID=5854 RepID=A0A2P9DRW8_PLARE|nr:erythrocyte membrane protein 1, PfEMP1 [Plasmodium reichenowi]
MAPGVSSGSPKDESVKHLFDRIGAEVHKKAKEEALKYEGALHGLLSKVVFSDTSGVTIHDACKLNYKFDTNVTEGRGRENPCHGRQSVRFSDINGAECYWNRIKGNGSSIGSCAPLRRLHLCDRNLEHIEPEKIKSTHNLLVDVLLEAKHEGESLLKNYEEYKKGNDAFDTSRCIVLARSFADIADIIRGKDLFLGHQQRKNQLEESLKTMFENIKENNTSLNTLTNEQIREYWWALNRKQVWKAITCKAADNDHYSKTTENGTMSQFYPKCGHYMQQDVPTYFDYVPQYLRWFHEWTEDFCRKRKVKLENAIKKCREGDDGEDKYCTLNGYDCIQTIRGDDHLVPDSDCTKCSVACDPYVKWIDIEKREFEKQKRKYDKEIRKKNERAITTRYGKINNMYAKEFYDKLEEEYKTVDKFLELLSKENICKSEPHVGEKKATPVDFTKDPDNTFSHTEYCDPCPWCGVYQEGTNWKARDENVCRKEKKKSFSYRDTTNITILSTDIRKKNMLQKYNKFCFNTENNDKQMENWKCHYEKSDGSDDCVLQNEKIGTPDQKNVSFYSFFWRWVSQMLDDSINWRIQLENCMNYAKSKQCMKRCKSPCDCYKKWVMRKSNEWNNIKKHFQKQDLPPGGHFKTLEWFLEDQFLDRIKEAYGNKKAIERIQNFLHNKDTTGNDNVVNQEDIVEKLLEHEMEDAVKCTGIHTKDPCENTTGGPSLTPGSRDVEEELDEEEEDNNVEEEEDNSNHAESAVCKMVKDLVKDKGGETTINGCNKKGDKNWTCNNEDVESNHIGACIPPRRQSLCLHDITVETDTIDKDKLRDPFIRCVAKETHFLWEKYKKDNNVKDDQLKNGTIPDDFKRIMYYTFADYKDIFFGTDMCANSRHTCTAKNNIYKAFGNVENGSKQQQWWEKNKSDIWQGMLCALPHSDEIKNKPEYKEPLEDFASRPQFLRWFTEWGDEFCKQRMGKVKVLEEVCKEYKCNESDDSKKQQCKTACKEYEKWLKNWRDQYIKQSGKYKKDKDGSKFDETPAKADVENATNAYQYLHTQLQTLCKNGECKCMKVVSKQPKENKSPVGSTDSMPASLDDEPEEVQGKCSCKPPPSACDIVKELFTTDNKFDDACTLKYINGKEKHTQWKCISDTTSSSSGNTPTSTCIPPRRQKMYVKPIESLVGTESRVDLRKAFIQASAVETFFQWHKFKMDKKKKKKPENGVGALLLHQDDDDEEEEEIPQQELEDGKIPDEFKRQMFYTLGDYRDILFGKDIGKDKDTLNEKIYKVFANGGKNPSVKTQQDFWNKYAQDIWEGMVCALSYDSKERTFKDEVHKKLTETNDYKYNKVTFKGGFDGASITKLEDFPQRPTFFRWLEEWGDEFCRKRTKKLAKIKYECRNSGREGHQYCSGDGHDCRLPYLKHNEMFADLYCDDCQKECTKYNEWIEKEVEEFYNQKNKYEKEISKLSSSSNKDDDEKYYQELKNRNYTSVDKFLESLNHCKNGEGDKDGRNKIDFSKPHKTFGPLEYCKTCPFYGVTCKSRGRCNENGNTWETVFNRQNKKNGNSTKFDVKMIDRRATYMENNLKKSLFKTSRLFKGIREQQWECRFNNEKMDVCKLDTFDDKIDLNEYTTFKVFLEYWLHDFLEGYYISKSNIELCTEKGENKCYENCKKNCACVKGWVDQKEKEWKEIKKHFNRQQPDDRHDMEYKVKIYFEKNATDLMKSIYDFVGFKKKEEYEDCSDADNCGNQNNGKKNDIVTILLSEVQKKINISNTEHDEKVDQNYCVQSPPDKPYDDTTPSSTSTDEDKTNTRPEFCKDIDGTKPKAPPEVPKKIQEEEKVEIMTCVEKAAKSIREKAQEKVNNNLKGNALSLNGKCHKINNAFLEEGNGSIKIIKTELDSIFPSYDEFKKKGNNRLKIGEGWKCHNVKTKESHICLPPRRENMFVKKIKDMTSRSVSNKNKLLEEIMTAAQHEGINILKNHDVKDAKHLYDICNDMKYSFADTSDIIRGRDLWQRGKDYERIKSRLRRIFDNIYNNMEPEEKSKYKDRVNYYELRSDWWDANRKDIWNAMTCNAPDAAKFLKKDTNDSSGNVVFSSDGIYLGHKKCGFGKDPPDYDYIPQPFRWMQEWSEYYCKLLNEEMEKFEKMCGECKNESNICKNNIQECNKCKEQCKNYKTIVSKWKDQLSEHDFKYKELHEKSKENENSVGFVGDYIKTFIEQMNKHCKDPKDVNEYLDKANNCLNFTFRDNNKAQQKYAFTEPPKDYVDACNCDPTDLLHECPFEYGNENACKSISTDIICAEKNFNVDLDDWNSRNIPYSTSKNNGVLVPPRRRQLCLPKINLNLNSIQNKDDFKTELMNSAFNEGKLLGEIYDKDKEKALQSMKYSFYDYGDIIKGTDMMNNYFLNELKRKLNVILKENNGNEISDDREKWWTQNKNPVWHAMLCGYKNAGGRVTIDDCSLPKEEGTPQFLRWFQEWTESFCTRREELYNQVKSACETATCTSDDGTIHPQICKTLCEQYRNYISRKKQEYQLLNHQYNKNFMNDKTEGKNGPEYFKAKCNSKCDCLSGKFIEKSKLENPYETLENDTLKTICDCIKIPPPPKKNDTKSEEKEKDESSKYVPIPLKPQKPLNPEVLPPSQSDESSITVNDILSTTIPFGIALALTSIAFFFMKKKPKHPVDLLRVLDIHKGEYGMPTKSSPNRYIPYKSSQYKGKSYIYIEGDSSGDEKYAFMSDTTDITSSESEYEELDINDIYPYQSPKYKTLIEVVLEPSGKTQNDIPSADTPTNKFTEEEWNQLKHDFISQYLPNTEPNNNYRSGDIPLNTHPNTLYFDDPEEKPFIMSIQDRNLYTGEEISYNMTNIVDSPYSGKNGQISDNHHPYSGIDLINDALSGNKHIDIYDEVLKRKENELFGTEHRPKRTTTNRFAKPTNSDPIMNQINLFHTWLDRHRDMCEKWENHHERLAKLKEKWENDNNSCDTTPSNNKTLNTNVSMEIDMDNPKPINIVDINHDNSSMDKPTMDNMENDIYYDVNDDDNNNNLPSVDDIPMDHNKVDVNVPKKVHVEMKILNNTSNGSLEQQFPISDVWNI